MVNREKTHSEKNAILWKNDKKQLFWAHFRCCKPIYLLWV